MTSERSRISVLKKARESKGLSLESVHETTKIPMDVLRAIEEGYSVRSVPPFYYKGFVKMYAEFLDVNVSEVMEALPKKQHNIRPVAQIEKESFDLVSWIDTVLTRKRKRRIIAGIGILLALFIFVKIIGFIKHRVGSSKPKVKIETVKTQKEKNSEPVIKKKETAKKNIKEEEKTVKLIEKKQEPPPVEIKPPEPKPELLAVAVAESGPKVAKNVTLTARAKKDIWLLVKSDDQIVFQSTLPSGSVETWVADKSVEISGRNLNQLDFELNGKLMQPLGRADRQAKRIVFTKEGLSVTK